MTTYEKRTYLLMAHDPVHIGAGGYRLGRVDNSIVREPGTRVPKIPGTSLHGAARSYAARLYDNPKAAGQSQDGVDNPERDPICYTFGYIKKTARGDNQTDEDTTAYSGVVNVFDARVVMFPVHSLIGPVWVSTTHRLAEAGFTVAEVPPNWPVDHVVTSWLRNDPLNLGWLMLRVAGQAAVTAPAPWQGDDWNHIQGRVVLVHESLFSAIVNSNLEVRTSVSIDPDTGAAKDAALFTYEALPRGTFLTCDVVLDEYRDGGEVFGNGGITHTLKSTTTPLPGGPWHGPMDVLQSGLDLIKWLGVGGMGTRGFGRLGRVGNPVIEQFI